MTGHRHGQCGWASCKGFTGLFPARVMDPVKCQENIQDMWKARPEGEPWLLVKYFEKGTP